MNNKETKWIPVVGPPLEQADGYLVFPGGTRKGANEEALPLLGLYVSNHEFSGGIVRATIEFTAVSGPTGCEIVLRYDPKSQGTLNAGVPAHGYPLFGVREYRNNTWNYFASVGDRLTALKPNHPYALSASVNGSVIRLEVDGVLVIHTELAQPLTRSQVGLFCIDTAAIRVHEFKVITQRPAAFVVMQFSSPSNDVYSEVIKQVCGELGVDVVRVDEQYAPGMIIADINRSILESTFVIADVTPVNANVFYEVGFAHGRGKPTILLAQRDTKLPFDVSPFRTLFYDNTIAGKPRLEAGLRASITAILGSQGAPTA